jgi:nitrate/nitrite transporter NarK
MGLVGAGNVGTAVSVLIAPPLTQAFGCTTVYALAALAISIPMAVMVIYAKEPPDLDKHATFKQHIACLYEKDGWAFSLIYAVTFGGFIGLAIFCPPTTTTSLQSVKYRLGSSPCWQRLCVQRCGCLAAGFLIASAG